MNATFVQPQLLKALSSDHCRSLMAGTVLISSIWAKLLHSAFGIGNFSFCDSATSTQSEYKHITEAVF